MADGIGRKSFSGAGRGRIGRASLGHKELTEKERQEKERIKANLWRDRARRKLLQSRQRLKALLRENERKSEMKEKTRRKNLNPLFAPLTPEFSRKSGCSLTHSTVPRKPKYSLIEPKERIYGAKWRKFPDSPRSMHPAIKKAVKEIRIGIKQKAEIFKNIQKNEEPVPASKPEEVSKEEEDV